MEEGPDDLDAPLPEREEEVAVGGVGGVAPDEAGFGALAVAPDHEANVRHQVEAAEAEVLRLDVDHIVAAHAAAAQSEAGEEERAHAQRVAADHHLQGLAVVVGAAQPAAVGELHAWDEGAERLAVVEPEGAEVDGVAGYGAELCAVGCPGQAQVCR